MRDRLHPARIATRRDVLIAGLGALAGLAMAACGGDDGERLVVTPALDGLTTDVVPIGIKLANTNVMADAPLMVALERGLFSAATLEPELRLRTDEVELIELLTTGAVNVVLSPLGPAFFNALQTGHALKLAGPVATDVQPLSLPLLISRERFESGEISSIADLAGQTVGMASTGFTTYLLGQALATAGLRLDDVELDLTSDRRLRTRLERGLIGAALVGEPAATEAVADGQVVVLSEDYLPGYTASYALTTATYLASEADTVSRLFRVLYSGCGEMLAEGFGSPRNQTIFQLYTGADSAVLAAMRPYGCTEDGAVDTTEVEDIQRFYRDHGMLNLTTAIDSGAFIDDRLAREAAAAPPQE